MNTLPERLKDPNEMYRMMFDSFAAMMRNAEPGIIQSFDGDAQTATIQLVTRERVVINGKVQWMDLPPLVDVPVYFPRAGGHMITFPVNPGDECLVVFADKCIDAWWQNGGVQNQIDKRRHDLSDGFAFVGYTSQPRKVQNYSPDSLMIRDESGENYIELKNDTVNINLTKEVNVNAPTVNVQADTINSNSTTANVTADTLTVQGNNTTIDGGALVITGDTVSIEAAADNVSICGIPFMWHLHDGVANGHGLTGGVTAG